MYQTQPDEGPLNPPLYTMTDINNQSYVGLNSGTIAPLPTFQKQKYKGPCDMNRTSTITLYLIFGVIILIGCGGLATCLYFLLESTGTYSSFSAYIYAGIGVSAFLILLGIVLYIIFGCCHRSNSVAPTNAQTTVDYVPKAEMVGLYHIDGNKGQNNYGNSARLSKSRKNRVSSALSTQVLFDSNELDDNDLYFSKRPKSVFAQQFQQPIVPPLHLHSPAPLPPPPTLLPVQFEEFPLERPVTVVKEVHHHHYNLPPPQPQPLFIKDSQELDENNDDAPIVRYQLNSKTGELRRINNQNADKFLYDALQNDIQGNNNNQAQVIQPFILQEVPPPQQSQQLVRVKSTLVPPPHTTALHGQPTSAVLVRNQYGQNVLVPTNQIQQPQQQILTVPPGTAKIIMRASAKRNKQN